MVRLLLPLMVLALSVVPNAYAKLTDIRTFTESFTKYPGFVPFYYDNESGKLYLEVRLDSQPMILQHSLARGLGSNDVGLDRGQLGKTHLVRFERHGGKMLLKALNTRYRAESKNPLERQSIEEAFASSVLAGFAIKAQSDNRALIDYTPYLLSDVHGVSTRLKATKQGAFSLDKQRSAVYMPRSKAFIKNTELEAMLTFTGNNAGQFVRATAADSNAVTLHLHHSYVALPDEGYQTRAFHPQSGFWSISHYDYAAPLTGDMKKQVIPRHRLKKKDPSKAVSEPVKPIIYYLDPGVPEPVRTALLEGARWWDDAFAAAGYENAFVVKMLPPGADPMDIRFNVIQWVHRATRGWSYGASVIDPRTGEIIKGHVTLGSLRVRQDLLIATALSAPFAKNDDTPEALTEMALNRIRQLSAHEIGHTLGIAHNFFSSSQGRVSVMDYPHPKITLENGEVSFKDAYDLGIGKWDKQVIKYGYGDYSDEATALKAVLAENHSKGLGFISDRDARAKGGAEPHSHLWDNGSDLIAEFKNLQQVRQHALAQFGPNNLKNGQPLSDLQTQLVPVYLLPRYQAEAVVKLIGGRHYYYAVKNAQMAPLKAVPAAKQNAAMSALMASLHADTLRLPESAAQWLLPLAYGEQANREHQAGRTGLMFDNTALAESYANHVLSLVLNPARLNRLMAQSEFTLSTLFEQMTDAVYGSDVAKESEQIQARIQYLTAYKLVALLNEPALTPEAKAQVKAHLEYLQHTVLKDGFTTRIGLTDAPFKRYLRALLGKALATHTWPESFTPLAMPPGSPI